MIRFGSKYEFIVYVYFVCVCLESDLRENEMREINSFFKIFSIFCKYILGLLLHLYAKKVVGFFNFFFTV